MESQCRRDTSSGNLLERVLAMSIGMAVGGALVLWAARMIWYSDPLRQIPEESALVMAFNISVPMAPGCVIVVWSGARSRRCRGRCLLR